MLLPWKFSTALGKHTRKCGLIHNLHKNDKNDFMTWSRRVILSVRGNLCGSTPTCGNKVVVPNCKLFGKVHTRALKNYPMPITAYKTHLGVIHKLYTSTISNPTNTVRHQKGQVMMQLSQQRIFSQMKKGTLWIHPETCQIYIQTWKSSDMQSTEVDDLYDHDATDPGPVLHPATRFGRVCNTQLGWEEEIMNCMNSKSGGGFAYYFGKIVN